MMVILYMIVFKGFFVFCENLKDFKLVICSV